MKTPATPYRIPIRAAIPNLLVLAALSVGSATGSEAPVDFDPSVDFSLFRTYSWKMGTPARSSEAQKRIEAAVNRELQERGLEQVSQNAQLLVLTHALAEKHTMEQLNDPAYFGYWSGVLAAPYDFGVGTLVVDLVDAAREKVIWRGVASSTVSGSLDRMTKKIDKMVRKLLGDFPPDSDP